MVWVCVAKKVHKMDESWSKALCVTLSKPNDDSAGQRNWGKPSDDFLANQTWLRVTNVQKWFFSPGKKTLVQFTSPLWIVLIVWFMCGCWPKKKVISFQPKTPMNHNLTPQNPVIFFLICFQWVQGQNNISNSPARPESFHSALVNDENDVEEPSSSRTSCIFGTCGS